MKARSILLFLTLVSAMALAQTNPVPFINNPLVPTSVAQGVGQFTLTVNGTGFVSSSMVRWNNSPLVTTFVSASQVTAIVPAPDVANTGTDSVTVVSPLPGGGISNVAYFSVAQPGVVELAASSYSVATGPYAVAEGDFNRDGKLDLALASQSGTSLTVGALSILLGNGDGTFAAATEYNVTNTSLFTLAVGDFNGDGKLDIVASGQVPHGEFAVFLGNGDGTFASPTFLTLNCGGADAVTAGDFNADGKLDVGISTYCGPVILLGNGDGTFQPEIDTNYYQAFGLAVGDFNGDGKLDFATGVDNAEGVNVFLGNGDGTFQTPPKVFNTENEPNGLNTADVNGDGKLDLLACGDSGWVDVLLGNGDGTFGPYATNPADSPVTINLGDFNRDGYVDVVTSDLTGTLSILLGNGNGTFQPYFKFSLSNNNVYPVGLVIGDFNGDGALDFATADFFTASASVAIQQSPQQDPVTINPTSLTFQDQLVGMRSVSQSTTLTNGSPTPVAISKVTATGDFEQTNNCGTSLAPGASCIFTVTFIPRSKGKLTGLLTVTDNALNSPQTVLLSGVGTVVDLSAKSINFGRQQVGTTSLPTSITLENLGKMQLSISSLSVGGADNQDFTETNTCGAGLAPGGRCSIAVTFTPSQSGGRSAAIYIIDNGGGSPQTVKLTGTGT